jgi:hypothetical protein
MVCYSLRNMAYKNRNHNTCPFKGQIHAQKCIYFVHKYDVIFYDILWDHSKGLESIRKNS